MAVEPIVLVDLVNDGVILREKNYLAALLWILGVTRGLLDLAREDQFVVKRHFEVTCPSIRMDSRLVVVPDSHHRYIGFLPKVNRNSVVLTWSERGQPNMKIIVGEIVPVDKLLYCAGVFAIPGHHVDVRGTSRDQVLFYLDLLPIKVEDLDSCQTEVMHIAPSLRYIDGDL